MLCELCKTEFIPKRFVQKYCGRICARKAFGRSIIFVHPRGHSKGEIGLETNMIKTSWPKSSHGGGYRVK